jgi:hypothetical protein
MNTKIICPTFIIIFCILLFFAIINNKRVEKLDNYIEKFDAATQPSTNVPPNARDDLIFGTNLSKSIINGTWTWFNTRFYKNSKPFNTATFNITDATSSNLFGSITIPNVGSLKVSLIRDATLTAYSLKNEFNIIVHLLNSNDPKYTSDTNRPWYINDTYNAIVTINIGDQLLLKFSIYKILDPEKEINPVIYTVIKSGDIFREYPPSIYDLKTYSVITSNNYVFPSDVISIANSDYISSTLDNNTKNIYNTINDSTYYGGNISFAIRRVFLSPTGNEIFTRVSDRISLQCIKNDTLPSKLTIKPFSHDQAANHLEKFFTVKATIVYFYKIFKTEVNYKYKNSNISHGNTSLLLQLDNSSSNNFFTTTDVNYPISSMQSKNMYYNDISNISKVNNITYKIAFLARQLPDTAGSKDSFTYVPFTKIYSLLS